MWRILAALAACLWASGGTAAASPEADSTAPGERPRPRVALVLSGGGARGIAHIGALRALEEEGIPVDAIAANSMGAVVGGVYASGRTAGELEKIVLSMDWRTLFSGRPDRRTLPVARRLDRHGTFAGVDLGWKDMELPAGLMADHRVNRFLIEQLAPAGYAAEGDFDRLPIRFRCVATALDSGERVVLGNGDLALAVRASMSIPIALAPVDWEGRPLIDGLVVDNLPIDVAREYGAVVVVAVDVSSPRLEPEEYRSALGVATQVSDLLTARRNADFDSKADVLVRPELGPHPATRYSDLDMLVDRGHEAMKAAIPEIRAKLEAAGLGGALAPRPPPELKRVLDGTPIAEVTVRGNERISEGVLRRTFNIPTGPGFVLEKGLRAFDKIEATGLLEHVWMDLEPVPEGLRVVLVVREAPPNRIEIGAAFTEWERARGVLRLVNRNTLGSGEETSLLLVASEAEVGGRLDLRGDFPFLVGVGYQLEGFVSSDEPRDFDPAGEAIRRARYDRRGVGAALQVSLERWGLLEAGVRVGRVGEASGLGGGPPERSDDERALLLRVVVDDMDSLLWPEAGQRLALHGLWNVRDLGATHPFWRLRGEGRLGRRLGGRIVLQIDALAGLSDDRVPAYDWFRIGGPYLIPGYHHEELKGPQALAGAVSVRCRIIGDLQVVVRAGAGDVFASRDRIGFSHLRWGGGVGLMYPSRVGPLALDLGWRGGGAMLVSLALGWN